MSIIFLAAMIAGLGCAQPSVVLNLPPSAGNPRNSEGDFIRLKDGRILFVYSHFSKGKGKASDNDPACLASRESSDGGRTWTTNSVVVVANEGGMNVMCASLLRLKDGSIALFYGVKNSKSDCRPAMRISKDEGKTWSARTMCVGEADKSYYVLNNGRAIQLSSGRLLLPLCKHHEPNGKFSYDGRLVCYLSDDSGRTWRRNRAEPFPTFNAEGKRVATEEPGAIELKDGRVLMYARTNHGRQWFCYSSDGGETWTKGEPGTLRSPCSPATIARLSNGDLLAVWNDHDVPFELMQLDLSLANDLRTPLTLGVSKDEGRTWPIRRVLAENPRGGLSYFAVLEVEGRLLLAHNAAGLDVESVPLDWLYGDGR